MIVEMKLIDPRSEPVMLNTIATNQTVWPFSQTLESTGRSAIPDSGGYAVHPDFAALPGTKKLAIIKTPLVKKHQKLAMFSFG
jgi:hypothetical protein